MTRVAFYPGSFDPVTFGHLDIIARASRIVDRLVIGIGINESKKALLAADVRVALVKEVTEQIAEHSSLKIEVVTFNGLAVDAAKKAKATVIVRGVRDAADFDYEVRMAQMNSSLAAELETVFMAASPATRMISSSLIKQIASMGGDVSAFLPKQAENAMRKAMKA
jgi:pantetheine-phosphate adenylyltransferase